MSPVLSLKVEDVSAESLNLFAVISFSNETCSILIRDYLSKSLWKKIDMQLPSKGINAIDYLQELPENSFWRETLWGIKTRLFFISALATVEYNFSSLYKIDFSLESVKNAYDSYFKGKFNEESSINAWITLEDSKLKILDEMTSRDNLEKNSLISNIVSSYLSSTVEDNNNSIDIYTKPLYELLYSKLKFKEETVLKLSVKSLREALNMQDKYKKFSDFDKYVLTKSISSINQKTTLFITEVDRIFNNTKKEIDFVEFHYSDLQSNETSSKSTTEVRHITSINSDRPKTNIVRVKKSKKTPKIEKRVKERNLKFIRKSTKLPSQLIYLMRKNKRVDEVNLNSSVHFDIPGSFIYFLVREDTIVYVGQSHNNTLSRLKYHSNNKEFDRILIMSCPKVKLNKVEHYFIYKFLPEYNKVLSIKSIDLEDDDLNEYKI
jgi:hypothetical protein